jgi:CDP-paratose 2-epimerase
MSDVGRDGGAGRAPARALVTGGAGFIGSNLAAALVRRGARVKVLDDLSRPGAQLNRSWLEREGSGEIEFVLADVRDAEAVRRAVSDVDAVYHLAGQTAVVTSVVDPRADFESNALGTLNVLEAARASARQPVVVFASTNKVYGSLAGVPVDEEPTRFRFRDLPHGIPETQPLSFESPYACSKGAGDQYTLDYHRIYGLPTIVLRQSCIYGPRQLPLEEQGWVAWLVAAAAQSRAITIFGTGKQVRDLLHVDDAIEAYLLATAAIERAAGNAYNIGGGQERAVSVWHEFAALLEDVLGRAVEKPTFAPARPGDQQVFYCDTRSAERDLGWRPRVSVRDGLARLAAWVQSSPELLAAGHGRR